VGWWVGVCEFRMGLRNAWAVDTNLTPPPPARRAARTFTTPYVGDVEDAGPAAGTEAENAGAASAAADPSTASTTAPRAWRWAPTPDRADRALLTARDPILFHAEVPLYESELEDCGTATLAARVRVMPRCWFVLLRLFVRVDGGAVRLREARYFCRFDKDSEGAGAPPRVLREVRRSEGAFGALRSAGAPPEGPAYADGDAAAAALAAVAPAGVALYAAEALEAA
jgi:type 2A phosphatase activator TIP41